MSKTLKARTIALEDRTCVFVQRVRGFLKELPPAAVAPEKAKTLIREASAVDANCVDANEALSKEDYFMRIKLAKNGAVNAGKLLRSLELGKAKKLKAERDSIASEGEALASIFATTIAEGDSSVWPPILDI